LFDVFDPSGRFLGEVTLPVRVREFTLNAGLLAGVVLDDVEVQRVGIWRVSR
jgi:hypothetical protein